MSDRLIVEGRVSPRPWWIMIGTAVLTVLMAWNSPIGSQTGAPDAAYEIDLTVDTNSVVEGQTATITVTATRGAVWDANVSVPVVILPGSTDGSADYSATTTRFNVAITAGQESGTSEFTLAAVSDSNLLENEAVVVSGGMLSGYTINPAAISITDAPPNAVSVSDRAPLVQLNVDTDPSTNGLQLSLPEGVMSREVTVTAVLIYGDNRVRSSPSVITVTVGDGTAEPADYMIPDGEETFDVIIDAGSLSGSATFTLTTNTDNILEIDDKLSITGAGDANSFTNADLPIFDSGDIILSVDADSGTPGDQTMIGEGITDRTVTVTAASSGGRILEDATLVTVNVKSGTAETSDYTLPDDKQIQFTVTIPAGSSEAYDTFRLSTLDDNVAAESDVLSIEGTIVSDVIGVISTSLTIGDSDRVIGLKVDADSDVTGAQTSVAEGVTSRTVTVTAAVPDAGTVEADTSITVSVGDGTASSADYTIPAGEAMFTVTIPAGDSDSSGTFTLSTTADDITAEGEELLITGTTATSTLTVTPVKLSILDPSSEPEPAASINLSADKTTIQEGNVETVTVTAAFPDNKTLPVPVTVSVTVAASGDTTPADYTASISSFDITIPMDDNSASRTFTLTAHNDNIAGETNDKVKITGTSSGFTFNSPLLVNIADTDIQPDILIDADVSSVSEGDRPQSVKVTASLDGAKWSHNIVVNVEVSGGTAESSDYQLFNPDFTVTIRKETRQSSGFFKLTALQDQDNTEGDESVIITGSVPGRVHGSQFTVGSDSVIINNRAPASPPPADTPVPTTMMPPEYDPDPKDKVNPPSTDATLRVLSVSPNVMLPDFAYQLTPSFTPDTLSYATSLSSSVWAIQLWPLAAHPEATVRIAGQVVSDSHQLPIGNSQQVVSVHVTAEDNKTTRIYQVTINKTSGSGTSDNLPAMTACVGPALRNYGFEDVRGLSTHAINCIAYYGITVGRTPTRYSPDEVVPRWQMALFLYRAAIPAGITLPAVQDQGFVDISDRSLRDRNAINLVAQLGIIPGRGDTFDPHGEITRADMALMLDSFLGLVTVGEGGTVRDSVEPDLTLFEDIADLSGREQLAIRRIFEMGVTRGTSTVSYEPAGLVTRVQMAQFLARMLAHTIARPIGVTIQADPSTLQDGRVDVVVSVRDDRYGPVESARVDLFNVARVRDAFLDDGTCSGKVHTIGTGTQVCVIDSNDPVTGSHGDSRISTDYRPGTVVFGWEGELGAVLGDSTQTGRLVL